jgi:hypothetical protein
MRSTHNLFWTTYKLRFRAPCIQSASIIISLNNRHEFFDNYSLEKDKDAHGPSCVRFQQTKAKPHILDISKKKNLSVYLIK